MGAPATSARRLHGGLEGAVPTRRGTYHPNAGITIKVPVTVTVNTVTIAGLGK